MSNTFPRDEATHEAQRPILLHSAAHQPPPPDSSSPAAAAAPSGDPFGRLRRWSDVLDRAFRLPGTGFRFGWDPLLGLIPGIGDLATPIFSALLLIQGFRMRIPQVVQLRMVLNVLLDVALGFVPVVGDLFDFAWKANARNMRLLERHLDSSTPARTGDWIFVISMLTLLGLLVLAPILMVIWVIARFGLI